VDAAFFHHPIFTIEYGGSMEVFLICREDPGKGKAQNRPCYPAKINLYRDPGTGYDSVSKKFCTTIGKDWEDV
jgi:hypothetical protein